MLVWAPQSIAASAINVWRRVFTTHLTFRVDRRQGMTAQLGARRLSFAPQVAVLLSKLVETELRGLQVGRALCSPLSLFGAGHGAVEDLALPLGVGREFHATAGLLELLSIHAGDGAHGVAELLALPFTLDAGACQFATAGFVQAPGWRDVNLLGAEARGIGVVDFSGLFAFVDRSGGWGQSVGESLLTKG